MSSKLSRVRTMALVASSGAALAFAIGGIVRVPSNQMAVCGRAGAAAARTTGPGIHFHWPIIETCVLLPDTPIEIRGSISIPTAQGALLDAEYSFHLDPRSAEPAQMLIGSRPGDLPSLGRSAMEAIVGALPSVALKPGMSPIDDLSARRAVEKRLGPLGLVAATLTIGRLHPHPESPIPASVAGQMGTLRAAYSGARFPVLVVGIDSADWTMMEPMMSRGELPAFRDLRRRGAWGVLKSAIPTLSPLLWTTMATGKTPDQHGIVDFLTLDPATGKQIPITSRSRKVAALWTILSDLGVPTLTVGWWATWPAEEVVGEMISDRVSYSLMDAGRGAAASEAVFPPSIAPEIARLAVKPGEITFTEAKTILDIGEAEFARAKSSLGDEASWREPAAHLLRILAATRTYHRIALDRLRARQPRLALVYYEGLDEVNHRFAAYELPAQRWADPARVAAYSGAVANFYRLQDRMLGELVAAADPNTVVIVLSDHGFASGDKRPTDVPPDIEGKPGRWHTLTGVILAAGPTVTPGRISRDPSILDVAPTILALLSLPRALDLPGRAIPEIIRPGSVPGPPFAEISSYGGARGARSPGVSERSTGVDEEMMAKLTALGYIGSSGDPNVPSAGSAPGTVTGHLNTANSLLSKRNYQEAEPEYRAALDLAPEYVPARLGLAQCLIATGREDEGWRVVASALEEGRDLDPTIYMKVAGFYRRQSHAKEGAALFDRLPRKVGLEPARLTALGMLLDASGEREEALRDLRAALVEEPAFTDALRETYRILSARGADAALIPILERARRLRPEGVVSSNLLALTYERLRRRPEAVSLLEGILKTSPRDVATLANLAGMLARGGDPASALALLRRAHDVDPSSPEVLTDLLLTLGKLKDLPGAREIFRSAGPAAERTEVLNAMAYACFVNGQLIEAKDLLHRSLEREPEQPEARRLLGSIESAAASGSQPSSEKGPGI